MLSLHIVVFAVCFFNSSFFYACYLAQSPFSHVISLKAYAFTNMLNHYKNIYNIILTQIALKLKCVILMRIKGTTIAHVQPLPLSVFLCLAKMAYVLYRTYVFCGLVLFLHIHPIHFMCACFNRS